MGTVAVLRRAPPDVIAAAVRSPKKLEKLLFGELPPVRQVKPGGLLGFALRFLPITIEEVDPDAPMPPPDPDHHEVERWYELHAALTGSDGSAEGPWPAAFLVAGGQEVELDELDVPPRVLTRDQVREVDAFLRSAGPFDGVTGEELDDLRAFVREAAERGDGLVIHVG
jgi:hypothetical protein